MKMKGIAVIVVYFLFTLSLQLLSCAIFRSMAKLVVMVIDHVVKNIVDKL